MAIKKDDALQALQDFALSQPSFDIWGLIFGEYKSRRSGEGIEFKEFSRYEDGEDIAQIDPRASLRLGHPVIRENFTEEKIMRFVAFDDSPSMRHYDMREAALIALGCYLVSAVQNRDPVKVASISNDSHAEVSSEIYTYDEALGAVESLWEKRPPSRKTGVGYLKTFAQALSRGIPLQNISLLIISDLAFTDLKVARNKNQKSLELQSYDNLKTGLSGLSGESADTVFLGVSPNWNRFLSLRGFFRAKDSESGNCSLQFFTQNKAREFVRLNREREAVLERACSAYGIPLFWLHATNPQDILKELAESIRL